jgi:hypothetical protein
MKRKFTPICDNLLYTTSAIQSADLSEIINNIRPYILINFRKKTEKSAWYQATIEAFEEQKPVPKYNYDPEKSWRFIEFEYFEIPQGEVADDLLAIQKLCQKIVLEYMKNNKRVLLCCQDGVSTCGYIATVCKWWYEDGDIKTDLVKQLRERNDFITAKNKHQQRQMKDIMNYAKNIIKWKKFCN